MKKSFCLTCFLLFLFSHAHLFAQKDSAALPAFKTFVNGSLAIVNGWAPQEGRFYSKDWYEGGDKPANHSVGFHFGALGSVKISSSGFYIATGIEMSSYYLNSFRTQPAPDLRLIPPNAPIFDQSYADYVISSLHIPLYFQIPVLARRSTFIGMRAGVMNDYTYSEEYKIIYSDSSGNHTKSIFNGGTVSGIHYTATRALLGFDFEFHHANSRIVPFLSLNLATAPISSGSNENFLRYSSVLSFTFGFGYCLYRK